jgi:uracil-DNA glycosylase
MMAETEVDTLEAIKRELFAMTRSLHAYVQTEDATDENKGCCVVEMTKKKEPAPVAAKVPDTAPFTLEEIRLDLQGCQRCTLAEGRNTIVFGEGNNEAALLFVGEGPGEEEDKQARPFVGRAGQLLDKIIVAMGMKREDTYIANVVKCRPPKNRVPSPDEVAACTPFLERQISAIRPKVICALGASAAQHLLKTDVPVSVLRGQFHDYNGIPVMVTYHPAYLLRNPSAKKQVWEDMQKIMALL